jgi:ubiquinone/menaquinone biosynthesis C-methylase UbiE
MSPSKKGDREEHVNDLFLGTAEYYERYRVPYPQEVFDWIVNEYKLDGHGRLLDGGCGTGEVTLPLSRWFDEVIAIDPDQQMLQIGECAARDSGITNARFLKMSAEDVSNEVAPLRLATFGASFHWTDRVLVANRLYELLEPCGGLVVLAPSSIWRGPESWKQVVSKTTLPPSPRERCWAICRSRSKWTSAIVLLASLPKTSFRRRLSSPSSLHVSAHVKMRNRVAVNFVVQPDRSRELLDRLADSLNIPHECDGLFIGQLVS